MERGDIGVALEYSGDVPRVLAVARGRLVERMLELAQEHDITVYRDIDLAQALSHLQPGNEIPGELFRAVAEVLSYCYRMNDQFRKKLDARGF